MKHRVLLSLSNAQKEHAVATLREQIQGVNNRIDERCANGEEIPDRDADCLKVRKMRSMLTLVSGS